MSLLLLVPPPAPLLARPQARTSTAPWKAIQTRRLRYAWPTYAINEAKRSTLAERRRRPSDYFARARTCFGAGGVWRLCRLIAVNDALVNHAVDHGRRGGQRRGAASSCLPAFNARAALRTALA